MLKDNTLIIRLLLFFVAFCLVSGCTGFLNEGASRARLSPVTKNKSESSTPMFDAIYFSPDENNLNRINKSEYFSVSLLSAYICDFRESSLLDSFTYDNSNKPFKPDGTKSEGCSYGGLFRTGTTDRYTRGEIALVVNIGEAFDTNHIFNVEDRKTKGRVIYYNNDIRESGQLINAINLPIYGPKQYQGGNFIFDFWMMELDNNENKQVKSLLTSLAGIGGKAFPSSGPVLNVLEKLGAAFLSGSQDDTEAHFQMRFDIAGPGQDISSVFRAPLAEGYYALIREENRDLRPEWDKIAVSEKLGILCQSVDGEECTSNDDTYNKRTWFLFRIAKETEESGLKLEYAETVNNFIRKLETTNINNLSEQASAAAELSSAVEKLVCDKADENEKARLIELGKCLTKTE